MKIVLATGGFDPLHSGHIEYLTAAKKLGDLLVVGINSDEWLKRKKGNAFMSEPDRYDVVSALKCVDAVILFDDADGSACDAIAMVLEAYPKDDIIFVNGGDRTADNIPEQAVYSDHVEFVFGVGGTNKTNSSSWLLNSWTGKIRRQERERIVGLIEAERDAWTRPVSFSYKNALTALVERISE